MYLARIEKTIFIGGVYILEPLGLLLGVATFGVATRLKKPLRKMAVFTTTQGLSVVDIAKSAVHGIKEEVEDIVAEAHYENVKRKMSKFDETNEEMEIKQ